MRRTLGMALVFASIMALHGDAQPTQPIYLQYDGYVRNRDTRTLTLSFGYYNMNHVDVKIAPGDANAFVPGPADRNQPITFLEGRHRFACAIVVPDTFDGRLVWQVRFAGKTMTTTEKVLNPLYELELNSEKRVMSGLDLKAAPRGMCVNRSPGIQILNPGADINPNAETPAVQTFSGRVGQELTLTAQVEDDGLPRDSKLAIAWKKIGGPGAVTFSSQDTASTRVGFTAPGDYGLELSASDGEKSSTVKVMITVAPAAPSAGGEA